VFETVCFGSNIFIILLVDVKIVTFKIIVNNNS
jgi:hypothetical protein